MMKKGKILVTGGAGFIGSHTVVELIESGYEAIIADDLSNSEPSVLDGIREITGTQVPFEEVDCTDREAMDELFTKYKFDAVIHFAASKAVGESMENPLLYYQNNLGSLINVLELMVEHGTMRIVFSSSATVYGEPEILPVTELTPRQPATSPYGNTKQIAEDILRDSVRAYHGLRAIALRYFNPIGAHPSALIGELPKGVPNNLVPFITQTAAGILPELSVFGDDYPTPDGSAVRDYIDVVDLAKAHVAALERMRSGVGETAYEVFNIGTGKGLSVLELVHKFEEATGVKVPYKIVARRPGDIAQIWADTTKANEVLGWQAERPIAETLRAAWGWEKHIRKIK
jgi:UDP-glucose 4-epimerase